MKWPKIVTKEFERKICWALRRNNLFSCRATSHERAASCAKRESPLAERITQRQIRGAFTFITVVRLLETWLKYIH